MLGIAKIGRQGGNDFVVREEVTNRREAKGGVANCVREGEEREGGQKEGK